MTTQRRTPGPWSAAAWALMTFAAAVPGVRAQTPEPPGPLPPIRAETFDPVVDLGVEPAQYAVPGAVPATGGPLAAGRGLPPLPPTPAVQIVVLVPQDAPPKADLVYRIRITNTTAADAHKVRVRFPVPDDVEFVKAEPKPDRDNGAREPGKTLPPTEYFWDYKTLGPNASQSIQVTVRPKPDARELTARAYVSFEHGQQVLTRINAPKLKVRTEVPKQAVVGSPVPVRVTVTNDSRVPVLTVKLTENIPEGFEFDPDTGGERTNNRGQRAWEIGTLPPGGSRQVTYRVTSKAVGKLVVSSVAAGSHNTQGSDEASVVVKEAKIQVELKADGQVGDGESGLYETVVTNTGSLTLTNVRVTAVIPDGCRVTSMTNGGKETGDRVTWVIPRLSEDEPYSLRMRLTSADSGRKTVRVSAVAAQGVEHARQVETVFKGTASLHWETSFDQQTVVRDSSGTLTVVVKNTGGEPAQNVRLSVTLPQEVSLLRASPNGREKDGKQVTFEPRVIPAGKMAQYTIEFRGENPGSAHFKASLNADVLGPEPLRTQKYVEIVRQ